MFWKLVFTRQYTWLDSPEIAGQVLPWFQLQASSLHRWSLALWDPFQWCGHPIAAEGQSGTLYPLNWLLWAMPLHRTWLRHVYLNWYFVLVHAQAALFAYWLCRDQKRSVPASILGGIAFAFGPLAGSITWPAALNALAWAPLALLFFLRALRNQRPLFSAAACGAAIGAAWLTGSDEVPTALSLAFAALWIWRSYEIRSVRQPLIAALGAFGIGAMQILPGLQYLAYAPHIAAERAGAAWQSRAIVPMSLVNLFIPAAGDPALFVGWAILSLAAIGVWRHASERAVRICVLLAVASIAIAAGPFAMFSGALYSAHLIWKDPHSVLCLLALALPLPAAAGLDAVRQGAQPILVRRVLLAIAILCGIGLFLLSMIKGDDLDPLNPLALCGLVALATFALLEAASRRVISARAVGVLAILLAMWQFGHIAGESWRNIEFGWPRLTRLADSADLAAAVRSQPGPPRLVDPDHSAGFNIGDWLAVDQFDGLYGGTANIASVADLPAAHALGAAAYAVAAKINGEPAFQSRSGVRMYPNPAAFPRAWIVSRAASADSDERRLLSRPLSDFQSTAFFTARAPALGGCAQPGIASLASRGLRSITIRAALACPGAVVVSQTYYPGWRALVDGKPAQLLEADGFLDAVVAPSGAHTIQLVFEPWAVWMGAFITALSALLLLIVYKRDFV